jgi:hypothetical protein
MCFPVSSSLRLRIKASLAATLALFATSAALYAQSSDSSDVTALKAQMERMQKEYENRISAPTRILSPIKKTPRSAGQGNQKGNVNSISRRTALARQALVESNP